MIATGRLLAIAEAASRTLAQPLPFTEEALTGMLVMVCMECDRTMDPKPCVAALDGKVSHGLHVACVAAYKAKWCSR